MARRRARVSLAGREALVEREPDIRAVVLAQPHRRGNTDQRCASSFGRFCLRNKLSQSVHDAGEEYRGTTQRWRILKGVPCRREPGLSDGVGEIDNDLVRAIGSHMLTMERAMVAASLCGFYALRGMLLDDFEIGMDEDGPAAEALEALAVHLGFLRAAAA
jgi:hypothetical protein